MKTFPLIQLFALLASSSNGQVARNTFYKSLGGKRNIICVKNPLAEAYREQAIRGTDGLLLNPVR